jgi:adenosylhomocysteine nucleosidase
MKIGLVGAMPEEVDGIRAALEITASEDIAGRTYTLGRWHGVEIVLVFSRWGKVAAASTATTLLQHFHVDAILFIGVAGAAHPDLRLGDVVIATDLVQHDMDASALPMFQRFEIPLLGRARFPSPPDWIARALTAIPTDLAADLAADTRAEFGLDQPRVVTGLIASGDRFVSDPRFIAELRAALPDLQCVEMEGAAVAQVCHEHDRPLLVVRIISDLADHSASVDFPKFVTKVATVLGTKIASRVVAAFAASSKMNRR